MRTLSSLALAAQNAESSDEVWLLRLIIRHDNIGDGPLHFINNVENIKTFPGQLLSTSSIPSWTLTSITATAIGSGTATLLADTTTGASGRVSSPQRTGLSTGSNYTGVIKVLKDAVPRTSRYCLFRLRATAGNIVDINLDTSTGDTVVEGSGSAGVEDAGSHWMLWVTGTGQNNYYLDFYPAVGANATMGSGTHSATATGAAQVERPVLFQGVFGDAVEWIAFPFQIDLPGEDQEQAPAARLRIDNVDRQIVEAIRGLPSAPMADLEIVLASQPETVEIGHYDLTIRSADYDALYVDAAMTFEPIFTEPLTVEMTPARFPGLF